MSDIITENSNKRKGLGRGLGSLLGGQPASAHLNEAPKALAPTAASAPAKIQSMAANPQGLVTEGKVWQVAVDKLIPGEFQPRQNFRKEALEELAQSIKSHGILQPITVRKTAQGSKFEIIAGERRWRAAQLAGLHEVPVLIKTYSDKDSLELAIIENVQREDLDPIEEAEGYSRLAKEFQLSQQQIAEKVGRERATVANAMRLLSLPQEVKRMIQDQEIAVGHAKILLAVTDSTKLLNLARQVSRDKISVRKLEKLIQEKLKPAVATSATKAAEENVTQRLISGLCEELQKTLGTKVNIDYQNSKGKISIHFYSDDELTQIIDRLKEAQ